MSVTNGISANPYANAVTQTQVAGGVGMAVPARMASYSTTTGLPTSVSNGTVADVTGYDDFGRMVSYNENTSAVGGQANPVTTSYDPTRGWVSGTQDAHTATSYTYDASGEHRGLATGMSVTVNGSTSYTGSFTASYAADGHVAAETDPNGVTMTLGRDENGQLTSLIDTTTAGSWLTDAETVGINGQLRTHSGPAGSQTYSYDNAVRLTETADTPTMGMCTIRTYGFDADSNRITTSSYPANSDRICQTQPYTGGTTISHSYDDADRLEASRPDSGLTYDTFGRIINLPGTDTNTTTAVAPAYYANDLVHAQTVGNTVQTWALDAEQRFAGWTVTVSGSTTATKTNHYDDASSDAPAWIGENSSASTWTVNLPDLTGGLGVVVNDAGVATYQYANLHGDVIATAAAGASTPNVAPDYDEYGNNPPVAGTDVDGNPTNTPAANARYGWLGAKQRSSDDQAGLILMGVRLYNPSLGRFLQTDPIPGGSANDYDYANQDPINTLDLDGRNTHTCLCALGNLARTALRRKGVIHRYIVGRRYRDADPGHVEAFKNEQARLQKRIRDVRRECRSGRGGVGPGLAFVAGLVTWFASGLTHLTYPGTYGPPAGVRRIDPPDDSSPGILQRIHDGIRNNLPDTL